METTTPKNRIAEIFKESDKIYYGTINVDSTYAKEFKFDHEPTGSELDTTLDNWLTAEAQRIAEAEALRQQELADLQAQIDLINGMV